MSTLPSSPVSTSQVSAHADENVSGGGTAALTLATLAALAMLIAGALLTARGQGYALLAGGGVSLILVLVAWGLASALRSSRTQSPLTATAIGSLPEKLDQISALLKTLSDHQLLSDRAKAIAFRDKDRDALRGAIREEMNRKDWDAALVLVNDMEREFGYQQEAAALRGEINNNRTEVIRRQISQAMAVIDQHTRAEQWTQALREAERLMQIYPQDEQVSRLPQEIEGRRQAHKRQLMESWHDAVNRKDVDGGIEVLKRLDPYLTPAEAESMQETARGIFKEKISILKNQFSSAVHAERWNEAVRIGDTIVRDFPNSRLALEVRDSMDALRQRAANSKGEAVRT